MNIKNLFVSLVLLVGLTILSSTVAFAAAGDVTLTMSANALNVRANEQNLQILKIAVTGDALGGNTVQDITLTDAGTSDLATDITNITFYNGDVSTSRSLGTFTTFNNGAGQLYNIVDVVVAAGKTVYIYVVVNLNGQASAGETFRWNVTAATLAAAGVATPGGASAAHTVAAASGVFLISGAQSIDSDADGKVDRIKVNMTGGAPQANDNTVIGSDFAVVRRSFTDQTATTTFVNTSNTVVTGTTTNDGEFFVIVTPPDANSTGDFYEITFTGATNRLENLGGLAAATQTVAAVDAAAPVITASVTGDAGPANGFIDRLTLTVSEQVSITDGSAGDGFAGLSISDSYVIANQDLAQALGSWAGLVLLTPKTAPNYDTGIKPNPTYVQASGATFEIRDRESQEVPNGETQATTDGATPIIVSATTLDSDGNGKLDKVRVLFSEVVRMDDADAAKGDGAGNAAGDYDTNKDAQDLGHGDVTGPAGSGAPGGVFTTDLKDVNRGFAAFGALYSLSSITESNAVNNTAATNVYEIALTGPGTLNTGVFTFIDVRYDATADGSKDEFEDLAGITVASNAAILEVDGAKPVISTIVTRDNAPATPDGKLDEFLVTFSEDLKTGLSNLGSGWTFTTAIPAYSGQAYGITAVAYGTSNNQLLFTIGNLGGAALPVNTSDRPTASYTPGVLVDPDANSNNAVAAFTNVQATDGAAPVIARAVALDTYKNATPATLIPDGKIDKVRIDFSEDLRDVGTGSVAILDANTAFAITFGGFAVAKSAAAVETFDASTSTSSLTITLTPGDANIPANDTDPLAVLPMDVVYTASIGGLVDANNGATVADIASGASIETDGAAPLVYIAETQDLDNNGKIDYYKLTFTEGVKDNTFDGYVNTNTVGSATTQWVVAGYSNVRIDPTVTADVDDDNVVWIKFDEKTTYDTDAKPQISTSSSTFKDKATAPGPNNLVAVISTGAESNNVTETDKAAPVLYQAIGQVASTNLRIFFSEPVSSTSGAAGVALSGVQGTDLTYINNSNVGTNATALSGAATTDLGSAKSWLITTDVNMTVADVTTDRLSVAATAIYDNGLTNAAVNLLNAVSITIDDVLSPSVVSIRFFDLDSDGKLDWARVEFSEAVNDATIDGYVATDVNANGTPDVYEALSSTITATPAVTTNWGIAGYTNVRASFRGVTAIPAAEKGTTSKDDAIVWFQFDEVAGLEGDTDVKPDVTTSSSTVADFKPNTLVALVSGGVTELDVAGPAIMGGGLTKTVGANAVEVRFSEPVRTALAGGQDLSTGDFTVTTASANVLGAGTITRFVVLDGGHTLRLIFDRDYFADGAIGTIAFSSGGAVNSPATSLSAGALGDLTGANAAASNGNTQTSAVTLAVGENVIAAPGGTTAPLTGTQGSVLTSDITRSANDLFSSAYVIGSTKVARYEIYASASVTDRILIAQFAPPSTNTSTVNVFTVRYALIPPDTLPRTYYVRAVGGSGSSGLSVGDDAIAMSLSAKPGDIVSGLKVGKDLSFTNSYRDAGTSEILAAVSDLVVIGTDIVAKDGVAPTAASALRVVDDPADNGLKVKATFTKASDDGLFYDFSGLNTARFYHVTGYNVYDALGLVATIPAGVSSYSFLARNRNTHTYVIKATDGANESAATNTNLAFAADNTQVADFNSDRTVDVADLALFAARFGQTSADVEFEPLFDLNTIKDNAIDVADLAIFAARFGQTTPFAKQEGLMSSSIKLQVRMENLSDSRIKVVVESDQLVDLKGYQFTMQYDKNKVSLQSIEQGSVIVDRGLFIEKKNETDVTVAAGAFADVVIEGKGILASFILKVKDPMDLSFTVDNIMMLNTKFEKSGIESIISTVKIVPSEFSLSQNYPNPFNPSTEIRYDLPVTTNVSLVIFDLIGREVRTLLNGSIEAGSYRVTWDGKDNFGKNISSGVYFYRITTEKFNQTKKMFLLK